MASVTKKIVSDNNVDEVSCEQSPILEKKKLKKTIKKNGKEKIDENSFVAHIARIKEAKSISDSVVTSVPLDARAASVALLWEIVFDILCNSSELGISDFNTVAGIIQKLASARVSEIPLADSSRTLADIPNALSPQTLAKIEEQLKLL